MNDRLGTPNFLTPAMRQGHIFTDLVYYLEEGETLPLRWHDNPDDETSTVPLLDADYQPLKEAPKGPAKVVVEVDLGESEDPNRITPPKEPYLRPAVAEVSPIESDDPIHKERERWTRPLYSIERDLTDFLTGLTATTIKGFARIGVPAREGLESLRDPAPNEEEPENAHAKLSIQLAFAIGQELLPWRDEVKAELGKHSGPLTLDLLAKQVRGFVLEDARTGERTHTTCEEIKAKVASMRESLDEASKGQYLAIRPDVFIASSHPRNLIVVGIDGPPLNN